MIRPKKSLRANGPLGTGPTGARPPETATLHYSHAYRTGLPLDQGTPRP
jgi:hypothetical protein